MPRTRVSFPFRILLIPLFLLTACAAEPTNTGVDARDRDEIRTDERYGRLFGEDALTFSAGTGTGADGPPGGGLGVNAFLWRASLDTLDFMPLVSADPFGGVIITDWYQPAADENERLKVNVFILDTQLRADALKVSVFRQTRSGNGWRDAPVDSAVGRQLEDTVLTRARELRLAAG